VVAVVEAAAEGVVGVAKVVEEAGDHTLDTAKTYNFN